MRLLTITPDGEISGFEQGDDRGEDELAGPNSVAHPDSLSEEWNFAEGDQIRMVEARINEQDPWAEGAEGVDSGVIIVDTGSSHGGNNSHAGSEFSVPGDDSLPSDIEDIVGNVAHSSSENSRLPREVEIRPANANRQKLEKWFSKWGYHSAAVAFLLIACVLRYRGVVTENERLRQETENLKEALETAKQQEYKESSSWSSVFDNCWIEANVRPGPCYSETKEDTRDFFENLMAGLQQQSVAASQVASQAWEGLKTDCQGVLDNVVDQASDKYTTSAQTLSEFIVQVHEARKAQAEVFIEKSIEGHQNLMAGFKSAAAATGEYIESFAQYISDELYPALEDEGSDDAKTSQSSSGQVASVADTVGALATSTKGVLGAGLATVAAAASLAVGEWIVTKVNESTDTSP